MFLGEPLRFFISSCFHFFRCLWMSSLLIAFVHFTSLFVRYFSFVLLLHCKCYGFERAFFTVRGFLPYTPSQHLAQPAFETLRFETQIWPICMFESHSVQQKVLIDGFYLYAWNINQPLTGFEPAF